MYETERGVFILAAWLKCEYGQDSQPVTEQQHTSHYLLCHLSGEECGVEIAYDNMATHPGQEKKHTDNCLN